MSDTPRRVLLGPQRPTPNIGDAIRSLDLPEGPIAVISAGWQEAEGDIDDVREIVGRSLVDLTIYARAQAALGDDPELAEAHRARQKALQELQRLYRLRLKSLASAAREVLDADGEPDMLAIEQRHAFAQLRALDRHHEHNTEALHESFSKEFDPATHPALAGHRQEIEEILATCAGVLITGGNVIVLQNRMRLFGVAPLIAGHDIVAWSAGAMALANHVVLYHDRMPLERRTPELLGRGLGLASGVVLLPDPERRLRTRDKLRMKLLSRRFSPDTCVALDSGTAITIANDKIVGVDGAARLTRNGGLVPVKAA